ncbi:MAG TPA: hypothetical protein VFW98_17960 [Gemmatimonadaceae bacterium]|nr:hypothetical protein [Gemmatimonadaceae bacterium]
MARWHRRLLGAGVVCVMLATRVAAQEQDRAAEAAAAALSDARKAQRAFESTRRAHLPTVFGGTPTCDITIGRLCYWNDNPDPPLPPEPRRIAQARDRLLRALDSAAARASADEWIAGQRVRYLIEAARLSDAVRAARECSAPRSWCALLLGFALHRSGDDSSANVAFDSALAAMPEHERCRWTDISEWLEGDVASRYHHLDCAGRDSLNARIWWLAQPLAMRPGASVRAEFLSRQVMIHLLMDAATPYAMPWGSDLARVMLRYGWPTSWAIVDDGIPRMATTFERPLMGHEPTPSFDVMPSTHAIEHPTAASEDDWTLTVPQAVMRYAPRYAASFTALAHQVARFRRGDSMLVVAAYDVGDDTAWAGRSLRAGLVLAPSPDIVAARRITDDARTHDVLSAVVPSRAQLVSLEVLAPTGHHVARARYGLQPLDGTAALSDLLLLARDSLRGTLAQLMSAARGSNVIAEGDTVGLYWECYAPATPGHPLTVRLRVAPEKQSWLHGLAHALHLASDPAPIALEWHDTGRADHSAGRTLRLGLGDLQPGQYRIELSVEGRGTPRASTVRHVRVVRRGEGR